MSNNLLDQLNKNRAIKEDFERRELEVAKTSEFLRLNKAVKTFIFDIKHHGSIKNSVEISGLEYLSKLEVIAEVHNISTELEVQFMIHQPDQKIPGKKIYTVRIIGS